ncbi:exosome complex exonuclease Rrp41 [Candidatus Woesearchaeota archaeon]|nr:exosome complex exonuclease Rrp41 [Candidatus Woesearchaeota archaeon]
MAYEQRFDGRGMTELRPFKAKAGIVRRADGSAMFQIGDTVAYAAVYGPRDLFPRFLQDPSRGILRCHYNMMPFSGSGERIRPGQNRRAKEISMVTEKALLPVLDLSEYPNAVVDVFIELPQTDAGSRCAGICAASIALADAGLSMKDMVSAIAIGRIEDKIVVDVNKKEEDYEGGMADIPIAMLPRTGELTLLQMDGELSKKDLARAIEAAKGAVKEIKEVQRQALKDKYEGDRK